MFIKMYFEKEDCIVEVDLNYYIRGVKNNELVPVTFNPYYLERSAKQVPWTYAKVKPVDLYPLEYTYSDPADNWKRKRCHVLPGERSMRNHFKVIDEYGWCGYVYNGYIKYDPDPIIKSCKMAMNSVYGIVTKAAEKRNRLDATIYSLAEWNRTKNYILNDEKVTKERIDECNRYFRDHDIPMRITNFKQNDNNRDQLDPMLYSYCKNDVINCKEMYDTMINNSKFAIKEVKFNGPATVVFWEDGTKTVVKCGPHDKIDYEKGLAMAITKRALGDNGHYYETIKKYAGEEMTKAENQVHDDIWMAYQTLVSAMEDKKATKADLLCAMEEAIGYLGSRLDK